MSSIPPPISTHTSHIESDPYGYGGQTTGAQDPWASYGMPAGGPGGGGGAVQTPEMQAYVQQLYYYHQMYQQMLYSATDPNQISQLRQYDSQVMQYLQEVGAPPPQEGMPMGGDPGSLGPQQEPSQYVNTPPDYQTKEAVVFEEGASSNAVIDRQDPDKREANYYQPSNVCNIPSNAANVKVTMQPDDGIEGGQMAVVEITFKNPDGSEEKRIVKYHGADREGFQLAINTPSTEQVDLTGVTADYEDKIKWGQSAEPEQLKGDPPTKMDGDTRIYDGQNFDISPVPTGKDEQTTVMASGDVTYTPNSNTEYTTVELDSEGNYLIKTYKEGPPASDLKETITVKGDLVNNINFACDPTRIEFMGELGKTDGHQINENEATGAGAKLHLTGEEPGGIHEGSPMNPNSLADTSISQISGTVPGDGKVIYNDAENVELKNYPPPKGASNVEITAPGTVTLHADSYDDTAKITKNADGSYTIVITDGETGKEVKYTIKGPPSAINLDLLPANVTYTDTAEGINDEVFTPSMNDRITVEGAENAPIDYPSRIDDLADFLGIEPQALVDKIGELYLSAPNKPDELIEWLGNTSNFPGDPPSTQLMQLLASVDTDLVGAMTSMKGKSLTDPIVQSKMQEMGNRIVADLKELYPGSSISCDMVEVEQNMFPGKDAYSAPMGFKVPVINFNGQHQVFNMGNLAELVWAGGKVPDNFGPDIFFWGGAVE